MDELSKNIINRLLNGEINALQLRDMIEDEKVYFRLIKDYESRKKLAKKFPEWAKDFNIEMPHPYSIEQASSEATARFKSEHFNYETVVDLTGGFGIDSYFFSLRAKKLIYIESEIELFNTVKSNFRYLQRKNVEFHNIDAHNFTIGRTSADDLLYIDPARRAENNKKIHQIQDCYPNILDLGRHFLQKFRQVVIKSSPFLDIKHGLKTLQGINKVYSISSGGELKEVLYCYDNESADRSLKYYSVVINKTGTRIYEFENHDEFETEYSNPLKYLYEPDSSVLKLGIFRQLGTRFNLKKIGVNTHLYTSDVLLNDFPGEAFEVIAKVKPEKNELKKVLPDMKANLVLRNYPSTTNSLKKKLKLNDGGEDFIFASRFEDKKHYLIICRKVKD